MKQAFSLNIIDQHTQKVIDSQEVASIPPGCDKQNITGLLTIRINMQYLNTFREKTALRCKLWGREGDYLHFKK